MKTITLLFISLMFIIGCDVEDETNDPANIYYNLAFQGIQTGVLYQQHHIVRNQTHLSSLLATSELMGPEPATDFNSNMFIVVFSASNPCNTTTVSSVYELSGSIKVNINISTAGSEVCLPVIGGTYMFIELEQATKPVSVNFEFE